MAKISINLVTWNGENYVEECLRSVMNQSFKDFSVVVIDNGSTDNTVEVIREKYPHLKIVEHKNNQGFAKAHNQAVHWTNSQYVLMLNQDVALHEDFLKETVRFLDNNSNVGAVSGRIYKMKEGEKTNYIDSLGLRIYKNFKVLDLGSGEVGLEREKQNKEVFGVSGAAPVFRRKALEEVVYQKEYFDESFFSYKEDVDLSFRLRLAGWESWCVVGAVAHHVRSVSGSGEKDGNKKIFKNRRSKSRFANYYSYRNHLYFLKKCLPKMTFAVFFYEFSKFLYLLLFEVRTLKAWKDFMANKKELKAKRRVILKNRKIETSELNKWLK